MRQVFLPGVLLFGLCALLSAAQAQPKPAIILPAPFALELHPGQTSIAAADPALRGLLASARAGSLRVSHDLAHSVEQGVTQVTFTAWDGDKPVATANAALFVLPHGMTPVGVTTDENATSGNSATHIGVDAVGRAHMVWVDGSGPWYRRAVVDARDEVHFQGEPVAFATPAPSEWSAYPALSVDGMAVHLAFQGGQKLFERSVIAAGDTTTLGPVHDVGLPSPGRDIGPSIVSQGDIVQVITPQGQFAQSTDGGQHFVNETIATPPGSHVISSALARDNKGVLHVAMSVGIRFGNNEMSNKGKGSGNYWQMLIATRDAGGHWSPTRDALAGLPEWAEPPLTEDAIAAWTRVLVDEQGAEHLTWHGTAVSRVFGQDQGWYAYRPTPEAVVKPIALAPRDPEHGINYSFAPGLTLDGDRALALVFFDVMDGSDWRGLDSRLLEFRNGAPTGKSLTVTDFMRRSIDAKRPQDGLSVRFPSPAPTLRRTADGHAWLDVVETLIPRGVENAPMLIVYQRIDLTAVGMLKRSWW